MMPIPRHFILAIVTPVLMVCTAGLSPASAQQPRKCLLSFNQCRSMCLAKGNQDKRCENVCARRDCVEDNAANAPRPTGRPANARGAEKDQPGNAAVAKTQVSAAQPFLRSGGQFFRQGQYQDAIAEYDKAISADPKNPAGYVGRGWSRTRLGRYVESIPDYNEALKLNPRNVDALNLRAVAYHFGTGDYARALADFDAVLAIDPSYVGVYAFRAVTYADMGDPQRGLKDIDTALKLNPRYPFTYGNQGAIFNKLQQYDKAIDSYNKQLELNPVGTFPIYAGRGLAYLNLGNLDQALADYNQSLAINPNFGFALGYRGRIYVEKGQYDLALKDLDAARALLPKNTNVLVWRAKAYELSGRLDAARNDYKAILELNPAHGVAIAGIERIEGKIALASGTAKPNADRRNFRTALVIGNSQYGAVDKLANPERDAKLVAETLGHLGFEKVQLLTNGSREAMASALKSFAETAATADWAVIYYAGHGIEFDGSNYLVPVDVKYELDEDIPKESIALDLILNAVGGASKLRLVILDACRENPFVTDMKKSDNAAIGRGLARIEPESGTLVAFATKHGHIATDGAGQDSPFALALVERMETPGLEVNQLFRLVHDQVYAATGKQQEPFTYGQLPAQQFYFKR
jgi:tetratricopeptide (TPR) repeat protein